LHAYVRHSVDGREKKGKGKKGKGKKPAEGGKDGEGGDSTAGRSVNYIQRSDWSWHINQSENSIFEFEEIRKCTREHNDGVIHHDIIMTS